MGKDYQALFAQKKNIELPQGLLETVLVRVRFEQKKSARREVAFVASLAAGSLFALIPAVSYIVNSFLQSGFHQYLTLVFSEGLGVIGFWKEILMSLAESLPIFSVAIFLSILVVFIWSTARTTRDVKTIFLSA